MTFDLNSSRESENELSLIRVRCGTEQPKNLPRLEIDEVENKYRFIRYLEQTEKTDPRVRGSLSAVREVTSVIEFCLRGDKLAG